MRHSDDLARRVMAAHAAVSCLDEEHDAVARLSEDGTASDSIRLARLTERAGDVAHTFLMGDRPLDDALLGLVACGLAWIDALTLERAR